MKKILFLVLLISSISYGQAIAPTRVKITSNVISTSAPFINAQETDGFVNKINKADLVDVLEFSSATTLPITGVAGKIYVTIDNRKIYRWNGTFYSEMAITDISNKVDKVTGERLINAAEITKLANQSGTNTGDQDLSSYATNSNLALKANDNAVVHLTGEEIVTGPKTFDVSSNAYGVKVNNSLTGVGVSSINSSNGIGIRSANSSIGFGISSVNTSSGIGIGSYNSSTGKALVLNSSPAATGIPFSIQKNNADQLTINNNGEIKQFGSTSGDVTLKASSVAGVATILTLPATTGTVALLSDITGTNNGTNTGDETTATIQSKRPLKTIENQSLEGTGNIDLTKTDVGLSNIDNTTDLLKPISTATQTALNLKVNTSLVGANSGVASLDSSGKVPLSQINDALLGSVNYKGTYNASTNSPALPLASNKGFYYVVSTAGTQQGMNFVPGDWIISDGTAWGKVDNNNAVTSVNGQVGAVSLSTSNIAEGSNLYYTDTRVTNNSAVLANTAKVTNANHTGDATGSTALTLATVNANVGTFGNASNVTQSTVNAKGLTTAIANVPIQIVQSQVTGLVADLAGKAPSTGGTGYIQNQNASAQSANMWISGNSKFSGVSPYQEIRPTAWTGSFYMQSGINLSANAVGDYTGIQNPAGKGFFFARGAINDLEINTTGAATFSSTVTAPTFTGALNGNAASATNSTQWNGLTIAAATYTSGTVPSTAVYNSTNGRFEFGTWAQVQSFLGLGSNAYNSTAYLPLTGGNLTGALNGTTASFSSTINSSRSLSQSLEINGSGSISDPYGTASVTNASNANNYSYYGMTRSGQIGAGIGITSGNQIWLGTATSGLSGVMGGGWLVLNGGAATFSGSVTATAFFQSSDRRLKTILKRDGDVAYFKWKDNRDAKTHIGYIAQEVKKEYPDQVQKDEKGMLSVNYIEVLVAKIQDLEKRIKQLEK